MQQLMHKFKLQNQQQIYLMTICHSFKLPNCSLVLLVLCNGVIAQFVDHHAATIAIKRLWTPMQ